MGGIGTPEFIDTDFTKPLFAEAVQQQQQQQQQHSSNEYQQQQCGSNTFQQQQQPQNSNRNFEQRQPCDQNFQKQHEKLVELQILQQEKLRRLQQLREYRLKQQDKQQQQSDRQHTMDLSKGLFYMFHGFDFPQIFLGGTQSHESCQERFWFICKTAESMYIQFQTGLCVSAKGIAFHGEINLSF